MSLLQFHATGSRKTSNARVYLRPAAGPGTITINGQDGLAYFNRETLMMIVAQPLQATETEGAFDIIANVCGGGKSGQAEAVRHGISRALLVFNPELRPTLKHAGFLTRDSRGKERKKYGQKAARARYQFSKR